MDWALANGYEVPDEFVFVDRAKRGASSRREGLAGLKKAIESGAIDAVIIFTTNRLFRKTYKTLQFVEEEIAGRNLRCVFVKSGIDTDKKDEWESWLTMQALMDQQLTKTGKVHIRAAQAGLFLEQMVHGTITFGYAGKPVEGRGTTKAGRPRCKLVIDPETAQHVKNIFQWFVHERLTQTAIARRLNELRVPVPPRCVSGRWTPLFVKIAIKNERYRGVWRYGLKEAVWQSKADYVRGIPREKPLKEAVFGDLRIIDDATWFKAQELIAKDPHNAGRPPVDGDRRSRPRLLNGLLFCGYHDRPLIAGGGQGHYAICPVCREDASHQLYSHLDRRLALRVICRKIAELLRGDEALVVQVIAACQEAAEAAQRPDGAGMEDLQIRCDRLTTQISHVLDMPVETDEDRRETRDKVTELRRDRARLSAEIAQMRAAADKPVTIPTATQAKTLLQSFADVLLEAVDADDPKVMGKARAIIEVVTGGRISVYQDGPREPQRGWLRGAFVVNMVRLALQEHGVSAKTDAGSRNVEVVFQEPSTREVIADEVKRLWDEGVKFDEIAKRVGYNRTLVGKAFAHWHTSRGLEVPDSRRHLKRLPRQPRLAERIVEQVMMLVEQRVALQNIAKQLNTNRKRVTEAMKIGYARRNLSAPDGRALRKLRSKGRARDRAKAAKNAVLQSGCTATQATIELPIIPKEAHTIDGGHAAGDPQSVDQ